jgi:hypothetical protein
MASGIAKGNNSASFVHSTRSGIIARLDPPPRTWYSMTMSEMNYIFLAFERHASGG